MGAVLREWGLVCGGVSLRCFCMGVSGDIMDLSYIGWVMAECVLGIMEVEPDFENMTINEYLGYEAKMERWFRYDSEEDNLFLEYEPDPGELTRVVVEDIFGEPRFHMPNVLPTHPTLCQDLDFTLSTDFSGSDLIVSFPFRNRDKTFDPGISIEVQSKRFLSLNNFFISFISDPLSPVLENFASISSEIETKFFTSWNSCFQKRTISSSLSHRGFKAFKIIINYLK
ncbi:hypothetical protein Tco_0121063 [Tanacetum coccineum]